MFSFDGMYKKLLDPSYFGVLLLSLSFVTGFLPYTYEVISHGGSAYQTGDWLINYGGGFVRRGFFGQLLLTLTPNSTFGLFLLICIQGIFFFSIFIFFAYALLTRKASWLFTALICSPAGICFYGWDLDAFGRKEVIGFFVLVLLSVRMAIKHRKSLSNSLLLVCLLIWIFGVLTWEPTTLLLPFVMIILSSCNSHSHRTFLEKFAAFSFIITGLIGVIFSIAQKGNPEKALQICQKLRNNGYQGMQICSGAIDAIGWTSQFTLDQVHESFPLYFWFLPLFAFSIFPLVGSKILVGFERYALITFLPIFLLFVVVTDYGRWFSMYYTSLMITLIACGRTDTDLSSHMNSKYFGVIFLVSWGIPHWANDKSDFLFKGAIFTPVKVLAKSESSLKLSYSLTLLLLFYIYQIWISRKSQKNIA